MTNEIDSICLFLFYDKAVGKQLRYNGNSKFLHCNIIRFDGKHFVLLEISKTGIDYRLINAKTLNKLIRNLKLIDSLIAQVCVEVEKRCDIKWFPIWMRTCNEFARYVSGIDVGLTYNPLHLYKKLMKHDAERNYKILQGWERSDGIWRRYTGWSKCS